MISQVATIYYFAHFLIILPILSLDRADPAAAQFDLGKRAARGRAEAAPADLSGVRPATAAE